MAPLPDTSPVTPLRFAFLYPQLKKLTGAQRLILRLAEYTVAEGVPVTLVTHQIADEPRAALSSTVSLVETGQRVDYTGNHYADAVSEYALAASLVKHIPKNTTTVFGFGPPSMPALWWARRRRTKYALFAFLYEPPRFIDRERVEVRSGLGIIGHFVAPLFNVYGAVDRQFVAAADGLFANGQYGAARLHQAYGRDAVVISHGVDFTEPSADASTEVRIRYGISPTAPVLLSVNQLHPRKRLDLFIRTLAAVRQRYPDARGILVGRGVDEARLRTEARLRGVTDALTFTGFVPDSDLPAFYRAASVYLHTGRDETFGLSVLEAAWSGLPVVAVDEGGPREILAGGTLGSLVPATVEALADAICAILGDPRGTQMRAAQAQTSVRARYSWQAGARALIAATAQSPMLHETAK